MFLPIDHIPQENSVGCLAACSQMVLRHVGIHKSQRQLNRLFGLTEWGVKFSNVTRLSKYGVSVNVKFGDEFDLTALVEQQVPSIVFLRTKELTHWNTDTQHAIVVVGCDERGFFVNDPAFTDAPRHISTDELMLAWDWLDYAFAFVDKR